MTLKRLAVNKKVDKDASLLLTEWIVRMPDDAADNLLTEMVRYEMQDRLKVQREKGRHGWHTAMVDSSDLMGMLKKNLDEGDMIDVINLAAMILARRMLFGDTA